MLSMPDQKSTLRKAALQRRDALDPGKRIELSLEAAQHGEKIPLFGDDEFVPGTVVAGFHPIRSEIDPRPFMYELARRHARLCLPVVTSKTTIEFRELVRGAPMISSGFGTVGPDENAEVLDPTIILVPLSVFDLQGGRIGYGGGFYDRAVETLINKGATPKLIGMGFSVQQEDAVPMEPHDRFLDGILTENGYTPATHHSGT